MDVKIYGLMKMSWQNNFREFQTSLISNVTALEISDKFLIQDLLVRQIESRVRWRESINYMIKNGVDNFIEIGPKAKYYQDW